MRNFRLKAVQTNNHRLHLYLGSAKVEEGAEVMDHRFFVRAIIRHSDLVTKVPAYDLGLWCSAVKKFDKFTVRSMVRNLSQPWTCSPKHENGVSLFDVGVGAFD